MNRKGKWNMKELPSTAEDHPENSNHYSSICPECQTGALRLRRVTYFTWLNQELITVPDFPAWVCDVCGRREYDTRAITWLNTLLTPEAGRRIRYRRRNLPRSQ